MKAISNTVVHTAEKKPIKILLRDSEDLPIPKLDSTGQPSMTVQGNQLVPQYELGDAKASDLIRVLVFNIPREHQKSSDREPSYVVVSKLMADGSDQEIQLPDKAYQWLRELTERPIKQSPTTPEDKESRHLPFVVHLWGPSSGMAVQLALMTSDDRAVALDKMAG